MRETKVPSPPPISLLFSSQYDKALYLVGCNLVFHHESTQGQITLTLYQVLCFSRRALVDDEYPSETTPPPNIVCQQELSAPAGFEAMIHGGFMYVFLLRRKRRKSSGSVHVLTF